LAANFSFDGSYCNISAGICEDLLPPGRPAWFGLFSVCGSDWQPLQWHLWGGSNDVSCRIPAVEAYLGV